MTDSSLYCRLYYSSLGWLSAWLPLSSVPSVLPTVLTMLLTELLSIMLQDMPRPRFPPDLSPTSTEFR